MCSQDRFAGEGRAIIDPLPQYSPVGTTPMPVVRSAARMMIDAFMQRGSSYHQSRGIGVWVIVEHCEISGIPYSIRTTPGRSWTVIRKERK